MVDALSDWIRSGRIIDAILLLLALEFALLLAYRRRTGRGPAGLELVAMLAAGACLLLAGRSALHGGSWRAIAAWLAAAGVAHLCDLARRFARAPRP